ncbi:MAG: hypothetical protein K2Q26_10915 [Bdellovibrionales bacterium]|nr:hypothetical protein [Bdellovibrionales bacterium]
MKYFSVKFAFILSSAAVITNCSSIPEMEIKPYAMPGYTVEELQGSESDRDSIFQIEPMTDTVTQAEKELAPVNEEPSPEIALDPVPKVEEEMSEELDSTPAPSPKKKKSEKSAARKQASVFKNGFYTFSSSCQMKTQPDESSPDAGAVTEGKKLWLDSHNPQWLKAYKKAGTVYVPASCVQ